jgi:hypothetical protein
MSESKSYQTARGYTTAVDTRATDFAGASTIRVKPMTTRTADRDQKSYPCVFHCVDPACTCRVC